MEELDYCAPLGIPHSVFLSWSEEDQDKALAYRRDQRTRCSGCGTHEDEWERDKFAYVAWHDVCPGCQVLEQERRNVQEAGHGQGARVFLVTKAEAERMAADMGLDDSMFDDGDDDAERPLGDEKGLV